MPLVEVPVEANEMPVPSEVIAFCQEALARSDYLLEIRGGDLDAFVPSDPELIYPVLRQIAEDRAQPGRMFCEWGSGLGAATCLASMLGFAAYGIEIEEELVVASRQLANESDLAVEFVQGSFVPEKCQQEMDFEELSWLDCSSDSAYEQLGFDVDDFDVIFAYPWPGERFAIDQIFLASARDGALLVTYDTAGTVALHRKTPKRRRR